MKDFWKEGKTFVDDISQGKFFKKFLANGVISVSSLGIRILYRVFVFLIFWAFACAVCDGGKSKGKVFKQTIWYFMMVQILKSCITEASTWL